MKSIIIRGPFDVEIIDEDIPEAGPGEILVEAELSGISSGTEMFLYRGTYPNFKLKKWAQWQQYPVYPGYELVGRVVAVGPQARSAGSSESIDSLQPSAGVIIADTGEFEVGDRVICLGTHQQFSRVPATLAAKIPDSISNEQATLAVLATTTMHSTRRLQLEYGDTVAVIGMGVVGNLALQHAKCGGAAKTIALDLDRARLELAKKVGADFTIQVGAEDPIEAVLQYTHHIGADAVVEASGAEGTLQLALEIMRDRGTVELLGWRTKESSFIFGDLYFKEGKIIATRAIGPDPGLPYSYVRWGYDQSLRLAVEMIRDGRLKTDFFEPSRFSYTDIKKVYDQIDKDPTSIGLQAVLDWK
ncbi:MAG: zinc-binding alcohol dehydrogenase [Anaerolineales bacterium]|nr:MAG: zinc-binding alcohol dehydrogenase [Anaerolineales bacterium]